MTGRLRHSRALSGRAASCSDPPLFTPDGRTWLAYRAGARRGGSPSVALPDRGGVEGRASFVISFLFTPAPGSGQPSDDGTWGSRRVSWRRSWRAAVKIAERIGAHKCLECTVDVSVWLRATKCEHGGYRPHSARLREPIRHFLARAWLAALAICGGCGGDRASGFPNGGVDAGGGADAATAFDATAPEAESGLPSGFAGDASSPGESGCTTTCSVDLHQVLDCETPPNVLMTCPEIKPAAPMANALTPALGRPPTRARSAATTTWSSRTCPPTLIGAGEL